MIYGICKVQNYNKPENQDTGMFNKWMKVIKMKNKKGFTLIEIIVSIALLGIISVGMLSAMTSEFSLLKGTQKITEDVSSVQQKMELEISDVKKAVQSAATSQGKTLYTLFTGANQRSVYGYPREFEVSIGNTSRMLFTIIADNRMPEFEVASASINIDFSNGNKIIYAYKDTPSLYVKSTTTLDDPENVNLTNIYRWYVSRKGFYIPSPRDSNPTEIENGTKYPRFPDDYSIIPGVSTTNLINIASSYTGRHIICTVTPAARSGKMGATAVSKPVLLSGLPVINDLWVHLDASMISKDDVISVVSGVVKTWPDISGRVKNATQTTNNNRPSINEVYVGDVIDKGLQYETFVKYLAFDGSNDVLTANIGSLDLNDMTVFVVARNSGAKDFIINQNGAFNGLITIASNGTIEVGKSDTGFSHVDIAEVIIYKDTLSTTDLNLVRTYLEEKYNPTAPVLTIRFLQPVSVTLTQGDAYSLPEVVPATMSNGQTKRVAVTWSPSTVNTSSIGVITCTGTAVSDSTKTTTLTATIVTSSDTTAPTVTPLGTGLIDYEIAANASVDLVFSETLSDASKGLVQAALSAGCNKSLTYSWSGATLTITRNGSQKGTFADDVRANLTDLEGNTANDALLVDSVAVAADTTPPTVTHLNGNGNRFRIQRGSSADLTFSEVLSAQGKTNVQTALGNALTYSWNGRVLRMTNNSNGNVVYRVDIYASNVTDLAGNNAPSLLLIDYDNNNN